MSVNKTTETQKVTGRREAKAPQDPVGSSTSQSHRSIQRIRSRASYRLFQDLYDFLRSGPDIADVLRKVFEVLDARYSFGSTRNSEYAAESLDWVLKDQGSAAERLLSNFDLGEFFGDVSCRYGHKTRLFNIDRGHYVACDTCRTYIFVGSNLFSCWRQENKDIWQKNFDSVKGYKFIR